MKITNVGIINMLQLLNKYSDKKFPQKISYAINRNKLYLDEEYKVYQDSLEKLMKSYQDYFEKDDDGNLKTHENGIPFINSPHDQEFNEELAELLSLEVEVNKYSIPMEAFDYDDNGRYELLSANDIGILTNLLCEEN